MPNKTALHISKRVYERLNNMGLDFLIAQLENPSTDELKMEESQMKLKLARRILSCVIVVVLLVSTVMSVSATITYSPLMSSRSGSTTTINHEPKVNLISCYNQRWADDTGIDLYLSNVGLSSGFVRQNGRSFQLWLDELNADGSITIMREYRGQFSVYNGYYQPSSYWSHYAGGVGRVHSNNIARLRVTYAISEVSGDTTTAINAGVFRFGVWTC